MQIVAQPLRAQSCAEFGDVLEDGSGTDEEFVTLRQPFTVVAPSHAP